MSTWGWVITAYVVVFGGMALYAGRVIAKGRELARRLPEEDKPWT